MKKNNIVKWMAGLLLLILAFSCKKKDASVTTPADYIKQSESISIPSAITLPVNEPNGNTTVISLFAKGVQKYKTRQKANAQTGVYEWYLSGPKADLYNESNSIIGMHGVGPYWTIFPGSIVEGEAFDPVRSATSNDAGSIDWLLLKRKQGTTPSGVFQNVDYIQRIATRAGKAPAADPLYLTDTVDMPYTAVYRFSRKNL